MATKPENLRVFFDRKSDNLADLIVRAEDMLDWNGVNAGDLLQWLAEEAGIESWKIYEAGTWSEVGAMLTAAWAEEDRPPTKPAADQLTPEEHHQNQLDAASKYYTGLAIARAKLEAELKEIRGLEKDALATLTSIVNRGAEHHPLFDTAATDKEDGVAGPAKNDAWRSVPLAETGVRPATVKKLAEAGIETIGQFEDLRAEGDGAMVGLRTVKGLGQARVEEAVEAVLVWLSANRDAEVLADARAKE